jgi:hypothetical protein
MSSGDPERLTDSPLRRWFTPKSRGRGARRATVHRLEGRVSPESAEQVTVREAKAKLAELEREHKELTLAWAKATEMQQAVLQVEVDRLEAEIREWRPRTIPLSERIATLTAAETERAAERQKLLAEWPELECREKGEALKRIFKSVTLYWRAEFHPPKPGRARKTARQGRWRHVLEPERTEWVFVKADLDTSW